MEPIYRVDILKKVKKYFKKMDYGGLCHITEAFLRCNNINLSVRRAFPEYTFLNAKRFGATNSSGYWWKKGKFGLFSGRRRFLNWLIEQYKDDKTDLRNL